jgi:hypothetical protein
MIPLTVNPHINVLVDNEGVVRSVGTNVSPDLIVNVFREDETEKFNHEVSGDPFRTPALVVND